MMFLIGKRLRAMGECLTRASNDEHNLFLVQLIFISDRKNHNLCLIFKEKSFLHSPHQDDYLAAEESPNWSSSSSQVLLFNGIKKCAFISENIYQNTI